MKIAYHPIWSVGFRPFFILATLSGILLPITWALIYTGGLGVSNHSITPIQWHAHEMFFGFGFAVLGGFLLTATKNWVNIRGFHGYSLIYLVFTWITERFAICFGGNWPPLLFIFFTNLFLVSLVLMILWTLIKYHKTDLTYDNFYFILLMPLFIISKNLMLSADYFLLSTTMTLGLFRMAFILMLERTITQFMKSIFKVNILRNTIIDNLIKGLCFLLIFDSLLPSVISTLTTLAFIITLSYRFIFWKPQLAFKRLDLGIMYLGYISIILQLCFQLLNKFTGFSWIGALPLHIFTFGVMGFIIPAMIIRISKGHTGRIVIFDSLDKLSLWIMILAFVIRILFTQLYAEFYTIWIQLAAFCWLLTFSILFIKYTPFLLNPRIDEKDH